MTQFFAGFEEQMENWLQTQPSQPQLANEKIAEIYALAYRLYQEQQYQKAIEFFRLLTSADPFDSKYWKGLGAALQMAGDHTTAIQSYICAQMTHKGPPDLYVFIYAADCYFTLGQIELGLKALKGASLNAEEQNNTRVVEHVQLMRKQWSNYKSK
jgi:type III secretion system low calcium response chaperone LcrH/SycD